MIVSRMKVLGISLAFAGVLISGGLAAQPRSPAGAAAAAATPDPSFCNLNYKLVLAPTMPRTFHLTPGAGGQALANCIAWQEFIYSNWRAQKGSVGVPDASAPPAAFGDPVAVPANAETTVWESYHDKDELFPALSKRRRNLLALKRPGHQLFAAINKFEGASVDVHGTTQATGGWLTSRTGELTFYDVRVGNGEFAYIVGNGLGTRTGQGLCVRQRAGLQLPQGDGGTGKSLDTTCAGVPATYGENFGAVEYKAAWLPLRDPRLYPRYLITVADVLYPGTSVPKRNVVLGLVGLHIIHKMPGAQQFVWATFEHADNDPDTTQTGSGKPYTYFDPRSTAAPNVLPTPACTSPNVPAGCVPYTRPVQVVRESSFTQQTIDANASFQALIAANPSVFHNYELVDVQWPSKTVRVAPGARVPLPDGSAVPPNSVPSPGPNSELVANTTMETYIQDHSCLFCHMFGAIATPAPSAGAHAALVRTIVIAPLPKASPSAPPPPGSDYSFIFGDATR
jgi:hypothetical protein